MKDLRFTGEVGDTEVDVTYRVDLIGSDSENFTVHQVQLGDSFSPKDHADHDEIASEFKKLPYNLNAFKQFAEDNGLQLTIAQDTGENLEVLIAEPTPTPTPTT